MVELDKHEEMTPQAQYVELRSDIKNISNTLNSFISSSEKRHQQTENDVDGIRKSISESGRPNYPLIIAVVGMLGGLILLYIAPVRTDLEALKAQQVIAASAAQSEIHRVEDERHRDEDKFDDRLQREMRLLTDVVSTNSAATKEMLLGRMAIDEQRISDVTNRVDGMNADDRKELHAMFDYLMLNGTKKP